MQKHFFPGDTGVTVCAYPNGKLANGMQYTNLVSSGFTSPVIAGMVLDKNMSGALEIAGNLRQRHDGRHRCARQHRANLVRRDGRAAACTRRAVGGYSVDEVAS